MTETSTYPLRLPKSLKEAVEKLSKEDGTSINQFVTVAVAEKVSALRTQEYFQARRERADVDGALQVLSRSGGEPPRDGDEAAT